MSNALGRCKSILRPTRCAIAGTTEHNAQGTRAVQQLCAVHQYLPLPPLPQMRMVWCWISKSAGNDMDSMCRQIAIHGAHVVV
jgi:hypothetical protein